MVRRTWTRDDITSAIQAFYQRHRRWPVAPDCRAAEGLPAPSTMVRVWGTMDAAREAAGMPPNALPRRGTAFAHAWAGTWPRDAEVTSQGEEP